MLQLINHLFTPLLHSSGRLPVGYAPLDLAPFYLCQVGCIGITIVGDRSANLLLGLNPILYTDKIHGAIETGAMGVCHHDQRWVCQTPLLSA